MKSYKIKLFVVVTALFLVSNNTLFAQPPGGGEKRTPPTTDEIFEKFDANKDEIKGPLKDNFDTIDTDDDGFISREELDNAPKPERGIRPKK
ncbi:EF-hand domain-containing protein [Crocinitomix catalasitica]|uniref:EF-hand domain-containing protein n=1 Tax=Crocinitomix catalasitica TaxID=184607 RepID=UPI00048189FA|nr:EF-hand domain-containing protein [Crocinitomix catalasitica]